MRRARIFGSKGKRRGAVVEMAPLIDMVFILLIFFVVTTSFVKESGVEISRPESSQTQAIKESFVPVAIHKGGSVHIAGRAIAPDDSQSIRSTLERSKLSRIVIQADREVPTALLLKVLDTCNEAGAEKVDVAALKQ